jgi:hypothetical protein
VVTRGLFASTLILAATVTAGCVLAMPGPTAPTASCTAPPAPPGFVGWSTFDVPPESLKLTWEPSPGAVGTYIAELGTTRNASNIGVVEVHSDSRSYTFNRLTAGDYFGRVRARNDCGLSPYSNEAFPRVR